MLIVLVSHPTVLLLSSLINLINFINNCIIVNFINYNYNCIIIIIMFYSYYFTSAKT